MASLTLTPPLFGQLNLERMSFYFLFFVCHILTFIAMFSAVLVWFAMLLYTFLCSLDWSM